MLLVRDRRLISVTSLGASRAEVRSVAESLAPADEVQWAEGLRVGDPCEPSGPEPVVDPGSGLRGGDDRP